MSFVAIEFEGQEQGAIVPVEELKVLREDADDLARLAIHDEGLADDRGGALKLALPVSVAEHHGIRRSGGVFLAGKRMSENGSNSEQWKHAIADVDGAHPLGVATARHAHGIAVEYADILEGMVLLAVNEVVRGGHTEVGDFHARGGMPHADEFIRVRIGERLKQNALENAEHDRIAAYAGGQRNQRYGGEERGIRKPAEQVLQLVEEIMHGGCPPET